MSNMNISQEYESQPTFTLAALREGISLAYRTPTGHGLQFCDCADKASVQPVQVARQANIIPQPTPFEGRDPQRSMPLKGREDFTESTEGQRRCKNSTDAKSHIDEETEQNTRHRYEAQSMKQTMHKQSMEKTRHEQGQRRCKNGTDAKSHKNAEESQKQPSGENMTRSHGGGAIDENYEKDMMKMTRSQPSDENMKAIGGGGALIENYANKLRQLNNEDFLMKEDEIFNDVTQGVMQNISNSVHGRKGSDRGSDLGQASKAKAGEAMEESAMKIIKMF